MPAFALCKLPSSFVLKKKSLGREKKKKKEKKYGGTMTVGIRKTKQKRDQRDRSAK